MLRKGIWVFVLILSAVTMSAQTDSLERLFDEAALLMGQKQQRDQEQQAEISKYLDSIKISDELSKKFKFEIKIADAYRFFIQDSAMRYALKANVTAYHLNDIAKIDESRVKISWMFLLKGFFKEAIDTLKVINSEHLDFELRMDYYTAMYRVHYDLSSSRNKYFYKTYKKAGDIYCNKIWDEAPPRSYDYLLAKALHDLAWAHNTKSIQTYQFMLDSLSLNDHQKAVCHSGLGLQYGFKGNTPLQKYHLLKSTIYDLKANIKETTASRTLAQHLYEKGEIDKAYLFIQNAKQDADFYDSHLRKLEVAGVMPQIEMARFKVVEEEKSRANFISVFIAGISLIIIYLSIVFYQQVKKLDVARQEILNKTNDLAQRNNELGEANKIKEEYIGYYFNFSTQYIDRLESLKKSILQKITAKRFDDVDRELRKIDPTHERALLFEHFDQVFLSLFPNFVEQFNQLFGKEHQIQLKQNGTLNTDLRIFALIRLGITNNEKIAAALNLSVNTIYTYKTKIKKRSFIPNDEFEKRILEISFQ